MTRLPATSAAALRIVVPLLRNRGAEGALRVAHGIVELEHVGGRPSARGRVERRLRGPQRAGRLERSVLATFAAGCARRHSGPATRSPSMRTTHRSPLQWRCRSSRRPGPDRTRDASARFSSCRTSAPWGARRECPVHRDVALATRNTGRPEASRMTSPSATLRPAASVFVTIGLVAAATAERPCQCHRERLGERHRASDDDVGRQHLLLDRHRDQGRRGGVFVLQRPSAGDFTRRPSAHPPSAASTATATTPARMRRRWLDSADSGALTCRRRGDRRGTAVGTRA